MRVGLLLLLMLVLSACASQDERGENVTQDVDQAVRDFIEVRQLEDDDEIRTSNRDSWDQLSQRFIVFKTRKESYLVEFVRRCWELDEYPIVPDERQTSGRIYARFDTIRGCRIAKIYPLTEGELAELESIGESPGSRN